MQTMTLERETRTCLEQRLAELEVLGDKLLSHQRELADVLAGGGHSDGQLKAFYRSIKRAWGAEQHARRAADDVREALKALDLSADAESALALAV